MLSSSVGAGAEPFISLTGDTLWQEKRKTNADGGVPGSQAWRLSVHIRGIYVFTLLTGGETSGDERERHS